MAQIRLPLQQYKSREGIARIRRYLKEFHVLFLAKASLNQKAAQDFPKHPNAFDATKVWSVTV